MNLLKKLSGKKVRTLAPDDFIRRLRSLVIGEGMLSEGNIYLMDLAIREMPREGAVIEIGSYGGLSANLLTYLLQKHGREEKLFSCDPWIYEGYHDHKGRPPAHIDGRTDVLRSDYSAYMKQAYINAARLLHPQRLPYAFHQDSDTFFANWRKNAAAEDVFGRTTSTGGPIAFAYIDGDHSFTQAKKDFENTAEFLLPGGFILLDDSADGLPFGSAKMIQEIKKDKRFSVVMKNENYLVRKRD